LRPAIFVSSLVLVVAVISLGVLAYPWVPKIIRETATQTTTTRSTYTTIRSSTYTRYSTSYVNFTYYLIHFTNTYYSTTSWQEAVSTETFRSTSSSTNFHVIAVPPYAEYGFSGTVFAEVAMFVLLLSGAILLLREATLRGATPDKKYLRVRSCLNCGMELQPNAKFCDRCGSARP
jgi:hypothetical protein